MNGGGRKQEQEGGGVERDEADMEPETRDAREGQEPWRCIEADAMTRARDARHDGCAKSCRLSITHSLE